MGRKSGKEKRMEAGTLTLEDVLEDRYVPGTLEVGKDDNGVPHITMYGNAGHNCLRDGCNGNLVWLNSSNFVWNSYPLYCQTCNSAWRVDKKYLWPLVKEALGEETVEPEAVSPSAKSGFEEAVEAAHKHQDELKAAQDTIQKRKDAKAEARKPKMVQVQPKGQMSLTDALPKSSQPSNDRMRICTACGAEFERPIQRGKPPSKCEKCR